MSEVGRSSTQLDMSSGQLAVAASLFWAAAFNTALFSAALRDRPTDELSTWAFVGALATALIALHVLIVGLFAHRQTVKPLLALLTLASAGGAWFIGAYGIALDPTMLRNTMQTDAAEMRELLSPRFLIHMALFAGVPLLLLSRVRVVQCAWRRALWRRTVLLACALLVLCLSLWSVYQPMAALTRNHKEIRYLVTPANMLWSVGAVLLAGAKGAAKPREVIGRDATPGPSWAARHRPLVVLLVVGETARAANWGLNGYPRQTTPRLAQSGVINFSDVTSCGTSTETSLPCMFAPVGRRDYDEARIRGQQSLLQVLGRAGVIVDWRDNQSGCKGVCDTQTIVNAVSAPGLCDGQRCLDEALIQDLSARLEGAAGSQLWVLHMLGNHGPSYFRRYPPAFAQFQPECRNDDLGRCTTQSVVNAYDNALLYTDHVLAAAIARLKAAAADVDSALLYVSDHGESLGEKGLFLHGLPYAMAPDVQKQVPMVWWSSAGFEAAAGLRPGCLAPHLARQAQQPVGHDHLFHTLLGALDVRTALHEPKLDLTWDCRDVTRR